MRAIYIRVQLGEEVRVRGGFGTMNGQGRSRAGRGLRPEEEDDMGVPLSVGGRREGGVPLRAVLLGLGPDPCLGQMGCLWPAFTFFVTSFSFSVFHFVSFKTFAKELQFNQTKF
jgi:hypothetical protein